VKSAIRTLGFYEFDVLSRTNILKIENLNARKKELKNLKLPLKKMTKKN
jgi:hypothetical protein